jgi:hypothetical protein
MNKKSDQELKSILEDKTKYTDEAIEAVVFELDSRNLIEEEVVLDYKSQAKEREELIIIKEPILAKELEADESPFEELVQPSLYSKKAIQGFTIFFSTLFGSILMMSNLKAMNKPKERFQVLVFGISYTIFTIILLNVIPRMFFITLLFNIVGYVVLTEYFWNKHLGKELQFQKKGITKPLLISLGVLTLVILLQFLPMMLEGQV